MSDDSCWTVGSVGVQLVRGYNRAALVNDGCSRRRGRMKHAMRITGGLVGCLAVGIVLAGWRTGATAANSSDGVAATNPDKSETKIANSWDPKAAAA